MPTSNFSVLEHIINADPIVKCVMLILLLSSIACWAVVLEKTIRMRQLKKEILSIEAIGDGKTQTNEGGDFARKILASAQIEANETAEREESRSEIRLRLERAMKSCFKEELERLEIGLPLLATIGSSAPFIGLFGTVWGIMNSFTAISARQDTSLATVAPGIAEALFATALGLAAAIPAVMAYNHFAVKISRLSSRGGAAINHIAKNLSRNKNEHISKAPVELIKTGKTF
ncbi:MAG: MotA/TolQ/ExbB proton channel family protein [Hyphomicrobium sp.]